MKIIGITGGVGSGKSEILNILKNDYQAKVIQSDHVAHELMVPGAKSYDAIVQAFGNEILNEDQTINRPILGEIVFHDETKLSLLNSITHKNVDEEILSRIDQFGKEEPEGLLVIESALLVGAGYEKRFDQLWYIYTREEVRDKHTPIFIILFFIVFQFYLYISIFNVSSFVAADKFYNLLPCSEII